MRRHELQGTTSTVMNYLNIRIMGFPSHSHAACVWDSNLQETCQLLNSLRYLPEYSYRILRIFVLLFTWYQSDHRSTEYSTFGRTTLEPLFELVIRITQQVQ